MPAGGEEDEDEDEVEEEEEDEDEDEERVDEEVNSQVLRSRSDQHDSSDEASNDAHGSIPSMNTS
jgi:hypothetical protein